MEIQALAEKLQAVLEKLLAREIAISVETKDSNLPAPPEPAIHVSSYSWGDIYSGGGYTDTIAFALPRPDIGEPFSLRFEFSFHEESGQCDGWKLQLAHATPQEVAALREVFAPTQYTGHWRNGETPTISVDGVEQPF